MDRRTAARVSAGNPMRNRSCASANGRVRIARPRQEAEQGIGILARDQAEQRRAADDGEACLRQQGIQRTACRGDPPDLGTAKRIVPVRAVPVAMAPVDTGQSPISARNGPATAGGAITNPRRSPGSP